MGRRTCLQTLVLLLNLLTGSFLATANATACDPILINSAVLSESQLNFAKEIEHQWQSNIVNNHMERSIQSFFNFVNQEPGMIKLLEKMGFTFDLSKEKIHYPKDPWDFLKRTQHSNIRTGIAIRKKYSSETRYVTQLSDIPLDAENWHTHIRELPNSDYYGAIKNGIFPITISELFEDHEFQHFMSLYHPLVGTTYMEILKRQATLVLDKAISDKLAFMILESFAFVRSNDTAAKTAFSNFVTEYGLKSKNYTDLKHTIEMMPLSKIEILSKQFLELYPNLVFYLGGLIRDSQLVPGGFVSTEKPLLFLGNWRMARNQKSNIIDRFRNQNWRTLYSQLVLTHNFIYKAPIDYRISSAHIGISNIELEQFRIKHTALMDRSNTVSYLTMGLAEMIYSLQLAFDLELAPNEVIAAISNDEHPQHEKVKLFFIDAYTAVYQGDSKNASIYYRAFIEQERPSLLFPNRKAP